MFHVSFTCVPTPSSNVRALFVVFVWCDEFVVGLIVLLLFLVRTMEEVVTKPGGVVAIAPVDGYIGVAWLDSFTNHMTTSEVYCGSKGSDASDGALQWLTLLLSEYDSTILHFCRPTKISEPLLRFVDDAVVRQGSKVHLFTSSGRFADRLDAQLTALWSNAAHEEWRWKLRLERPSIVTALSAALDCAVRNGLTVAAVSDVAPQSVLSIDQSTMRVLGICRQEAHPSSHNGIGCSKEGNSVAALVSRGVHTPMGRALIKRWTLCPSNNITELRRRLSAVSFLTLPQHHDILIGLADVFKHSTSHPGALIEKLRASKHTAATYQGLLACCHSLLKVLALLSSLSTEVLPEPLQRTLRLIVTSATDVTEISRIIHNAIDLTSGGKCDVDVLRGVDGELDELRLRYDQLGPYLTTVAEDISISLSHHCSEPIKMRCVFTPAVGYLVAVDTVPETAVPFRPPREWSVVYQQIGTQFYRTAETAELDQSLGDINAAIVARRFEVQRLVDERILSLSPSLLSWLSVAELDCFVGLALCAQQQQWTAPVLIDEGDSGDPNPTSISIDVTGAFHPLLVNSAQQVVPFDFNSSQQSHRINIFTGPNGSGKSVMMSTIVIAVYLAHVGSFVPCRRAVFGIADRIIAIADEPSSAADNSSSGVGPGGASSFAVSVSSLNRATAISTRRTLVLVDEFGRSTLALDGIGLLASFLGELIESSRGPPLLLLSTHFTELLDPILGLVTSPLVRHLSMVVTIRTQRDVESIDPTCSAVPSGGAAVGSDVVVSLTFHFRCETARNRMLGSCAVQCAEACGVPIHIVQRAAELHRPMLTSIDDEMLSIVREQNAFYWTDYFLKRLCWDDDFEASLQRALSRL